MELEEEQKKQHSADQELINTLEAILFWKGEPMSVKELAKATEVSVEAVEEALGSLKTRLSGGVALQEVSGEYGLVTAPVASATIERLAKAEMKRDLGKAGLETLSIVLYRGPVTRADIDYIRGVSSQFIVRNLLLRGLIEKVQNPKDSRSFLYKPTAQLLSHLGLTSLSELPEIDTLTKELEAAVEATAPLDETLIDTENTLTDADDTEQESTPLDA